MSDTIVLPEFETLLFTLDATVATVTLNRPQVLNALNAQVFADLDAVFALIAKDPGVRVVLLTGAGPKAFAAGADIKELADTDAASGQALALKGQQIMTRIERCGKPVIACINGFALGGGCELAMACTLRIAAESARLGQPEVKLGLVPGYGGTQRLPRLVGASAALKLLLTGDMIAAPEALRLGLVDEVVPDALARGRQLAAVIAAQAPLAVAGCLEAVYAGAEIPLGDGLEYEAAVFGRLSDSADKKEGTAAFLEKRSPRWTGV